MTLEARIKTQLNEHGPISLADYMVLCLAHPEYGYYMRKDPFGTQGDFTTAPEISQIFGELIGAWLGMQWIIMGKPQAALAEIGPGRGTLMADILRTTAHIKGFHEAVSVHLMELSPVLRQKQWNVLGGKHPDMRWHTGFSEIPQKPLLLVANEFFDALPIRQFLHSKDGWKERMVEMDQQGNLAFTYLNAEPPPSLEEMPVAAKPYEYNEAAAQMAFVMANRIFTQGGVALIVDYGYEGPARGDTLQAVRNHQFHDPLIDPGMADLTAHVDFHALTKSAAAGGATVYGPVGQGAFLNALGAQERAASLFTKANEEQKTEIAAALTRLTSANQMGELFKALCLVHPSMPKPEGF